jgi:hypothetical protein
VRAAKGRMAHYAGQVQSSLQEGECMQDYHDTPNEFGPELNASLSIAHLGERQQRPEYRLVSHFSRTQSPFMAKSDIPSP